MKKLMGFFLVVIFSYPFLLSSTPKEEKVIVKVGDRSFLVEVADTPGRRQQGLMNRKELCPACGMLFFFKEEQPLSFWMKNTLISLDIVFIDRKKKIVDLVTLPPCEKEKPCTPYQSKKPAKYVLEVNAGTFTNVVGKKVNF